MNDDQKKAFNDQVALLPKPFQEAIAESHWEEHVVTVGTKASLYLDQIDELISEVALVLSGLIDEDTFRSRLVEELVINYDKADELIRALNHEVLEPVEALVQSKTQNKEPQFTPAQPTTASSVATPMPTQQFTTGVFKVAPEKYSVKSLETKKNIDPYHEPIE